MKIATKIDDWLVVRSPLAWAMAVPVLTVGLVLLVVMVTAGLYFPLRLSNISTFMDVFYWFAGASALVMVIWGAVVWSRVPQIPVDRRILGMLPVVSVLSFLMLCGPFVFGYLAESRLHTLSPYVLEMLEYIDDSEKEAEFDFEAIWKALPAEQRGKVDSCVDEEVDKVDSMKRYEPQELLKECIHDRGVMIISAQVFLGSDGVAEYRRARGERRTQLRTQLRELASFTNGIVHPDPEDPLGLETKIDSAHRSGLLWHCALVVVGSFPLFLALSALFSVQVVGPLAIVIYIPVIFLGEFSVGFSLGEVLLTLFGVTAAGGILAYITMGRTRIGDGLIVAHLLLMFWIPFLANTLNTEREISPTESAATVGLGVMLALFEFLLVFILLRRYRHSPKYLGVFGRWTPRILRR